MHTTSPTVLEMLRKPNRSQARGRFVDRYILAMQPLFTIAGAIIILAHVLATPDLYAQPKQPTASQAPVNADLRQMMRDAKPAARLVAALALARQEDVEAISVLIDLLAELDPGQRERAQDVLRELAGDWAPNVTLKLEDAVSRRILRDSWAAWWRNTDGEALLAEFRKRTLTSSDQDRIRGLIEQLGDRSFVMRERAAQDLVSYGTRAAPFLRQAGGGRDLERERRIKNCLRLMQEAKEHALPATAARLLALRRPPGSVETLLAYLPWAENVFQLHEVQAAILALAVQDGKLAPVLAEALTDKLPACRAAAGETLALVGGAKWRPAVHKLLRDLSPAVRLRVALALIEVKDKEAIPALIDSLADLPPEASLPAQEMLAQLAGGNAPTPPTDADPDLRKKCRDAWTAWWHSNGDSVDLTRLEPDSTSLACTHLIELDGRFGPPSKIFLATLKEAAYAGHHTLGKGAITGHPGDPLIEVRGKRYPNGLGTHPLSDGVATAKYQLNGKWRRFSAAAAINDSGAPFNPLRFQVIGDNRVLWRSEPLRDKGQSQKCDVNITGVRLLELQVHCPGNWSNAHAVWLDPCISPRLERRVKKQ
jgi:HEAT repeat protein